ncbi:eukaryotic mitochondrial regulator protein-domain-containing protein [Mycena belliarum]|uniref:Eukaryotic mitochondrial regulator protein-domain-containing protein n=1 Tax=Mycena belliarum TaxID=1033014 RepID=A0AAD6XVS5_9AGAR|nr:eukaryotic mitochondrial regulator protein-domain-containing protein [Mycena belliae]
MCTSYLPSSPGPLDRVLRFFVKRQGTEEELQEEQEAREGDGKGFRSWLKLNDQFRIAKPRNWFSMPDNPDAPFPMNPSFKPPTPISDAVRTRMYVDYMMDPETNNIRALSQRYHVSLKRVDAILRLKGMEEAYLKGKTLQTGFRWGMEMLLGVKSTQEPDRTDVHAADMLEQDENRDAARQRFQRQFWEMIPDDGKARLREPILPVALQHAKRVAERHAQSAEDHKSNPRLMPRFKDSPTVKSPRHKVQVVERAGRPAVHFVDVGGKFIDVQERLRRLAMAERRNMISARKSEAKVLGGYIPGRTRVERSRRVVVKRMIKLGLATVQRVGKRGRASMKAQAMRERKARRARAAAS